MIFFRPTSLADFKSFISLQQYKAVKVPGAEVAWADYPALQRDFPFLGACSKTEIDDWIVEHFSYISKYQLELGELRNTKIPTTGEEITVYRQSNFGSHHQEFQGRGDMVLVKDPTTGEVAGIVDRKGVGVSYRKVLENREILEELKKEGNENIKIQTRNLSSGLMYLGEAFIEAASLKVTQKVFDIVNSEEIYDNPFPAIAPFDRNSLQTIEGYFVLRLPFEVHAGPHGSQPAAIYARQAHIGRVWTGKIYTKFVNIKQADFFLSLCDGGTVRVRLPELIETSKTIEGGPVLKQHEVGLDLVKKYLAGEKKILAHRIDEVLAPVKERIQNAEQRKKTFTAIQSSSEAFARLVELIHSDPVRFCRFSEVIWYVAKYNPELVETHRQKIESITRRLLALNNKTKDIDSSNKPMRRWGLLLVGTLPRSERAEALHAESRRWFVEPEFLGRAASLFSFEELRNDLSYLYRYAGGWIKTEVDSLLMDASLANDPRERDWHNLHEWMKYQKEPNPPFPLKVQKEIFYYQLRNLF